MDAKEFTDRARAMKPRLFRIAYLSSRCYQDCEDAVQEALFKAWRHQGSLRENRYFETWLVRILINECRLIHRKNPAGRAEALPEDLPTPEPADPALRDALRGLDEKYRAPLVLHHLEGYTVREVASILKIPGTAARWRLEQGRKKLARALGEEGMTR
jgi:RNA polymerase sigma-70 factor (ECF subfamily)